EKFRESPYSDALRLVTMQQMFDLKENSSTGRILARTTDNRPFIASKVFGEGEVVMITTSLDERWGRFPADGRVSIPFTRYMILHLTNRKIAGGTTKAGDPLILFSSENTNSFDLVKPAKPGEKYRPRTKIEVPTPEPGQKRQVTTADTLRAGIYNIVPAGGADDSGPLFAVNPDLEETTNLSMASDEDVHNWLGSSVPVVQAGAGTESAVSQLRTRSEMTVWVLLFLFFLLVGEAVWAWICGRAW
ncbi:MAG TPA: hypothetical protein VG097_15350, partial [Gemmata sp.]|nr:hypothetical protein [Gemmata sp.]